MHDELELKEKIIQKSAEMFHQFGCAKVSMEEIASALGMSKKTLYKHFSNKE
ncbi:MAG: helix-turn-helix transcriptional regulator, partial [Ignavibacteria bacterium]|nr:helix-turn-helix transcriptional regulator [Ignavibacteria bacterium]